MTLTLGNIPNELRGIDDSMMLLAYLPEKRNDVSTEHWQNVIFRSIQIILEDLPPKEEAFITTINDQTYQ